MAARIATAFTTSSILASMNPTSTEHDFRFPRRPFADDVGAIRPDRDAAVAASSPGTGFVDLRASLDELRLDLDTTYIAAQDKLLTAPAFPGLGHYSACLDQSPEELQRQDPLATQIWRFFSKTKQSLPNQERMENLTWRMMHVNMLRRQQQHEQQHERQRQQQQQQHQLEQARCVSGLAPPCD